MGAMNELLDAEVVGTLRAQLQAAEPSLPFMHLEAAIGDLDGLALRARTDLVAAAVLRDLPDAYADVARVVRRALENPELAGWMTWPLGEVVTSAALADGTDAAFDDGLALLAELTPRLSSEFAIRRFLGVDLERALRTITTWVDSDDEHVRRLASEGTRPYLPWAIRIAQVVQQPQAAVPILDALHDDPSEYVRRSVANHLNDIARHDPELVVRVAGGWLEGGAPTAERTVRHGLRTLIKQADPGAMALLGFGPASVSVDAIELDAVAVQLPGSLGFSTVLENTGDAPARLAIDYVVHYRKANGTTSEKVFKLAVREVAAGERVPINKRHALRQMTTRVHHAGTHALELQVNGARFGRVEFEVAT